MPGRLEGKKIAMVCTRSFEKLEMTELHQASEEAEAETVLIAYESDKYPVDMLMAEATFLTEKGEFDALHLPGKPLQSRSGIPLNQPGLSAELKQQFSSYYAQVNGVRLHYVMGGSGEPLLLIPGWPQSWYAWRHVMPRLAENYTVIAIDPRGIGDSDKAGSGYDFANLATDVAELMEQVGYDSYRVVGHDLGMWIGYAVAAKYPERVERLTVIEAVIPGVADAPTIFQPPAENKKIWHFMFNQLPDLPETLIEGREREYLTWLFDNKAYRTSAIGPADLDEYVRIYSIPGAIRTGCEFYRAIPQSMEQAQQWQQQKLPMPVLAIGGSESTGLGPLKTMEKVADNVDGGEIVGCGHYLPEECPNELLQQLNDFMGQ